MKIDISELEKVEPVKMSSIAKKKVKVAAFESMSKNIPMSLNLIGMRVEEALIALKNYIDAALLARYEQVNIIHGFGTGALRKAVHEFLKSSIDIFSNPLYSLYNFLNSSFPSSMFFLRLDK